MRLGDRLCEDEGPRPELDPWWRRSAATSCGTCLWFSERPNYIVGRCRKACVTGSSATVTRQNWCSEHRTDDKRFCA